MKSNLVVWTWHKLIIWLSAAQDCYAQSSGSKESKIMEDFGLNGNSHFVFYLLVSFHLVIAFKMSSYLNTSK